MENLHTQGVWNFESNGSYITNETGNVLATVNSRVLNGGTSEEERKEALANAKLIASAPDMLNALNEAVIICSKHGLFSGRPDLYNLLTDTINKATNQ